MTSIILTLIAVMVLVPIAVLATVYIMVPFFTAVAWGIRQITRFIAGEVGDLFRIVGSLVTASVLGLMVILNIIVGRWSATAHFGRAVQAEGIAIGAAVYRMLIGHPARLLMLTSLTEGLERRLPAVIACAPAADGPGVAWYQDGPPRGRSARSMTIRVGGCGVSVEQHRRDGQSRRRAGQFDGYTIIGSLAGGGSGGKLYIAEPDAIKLASFERAGHRNVSRVVIKTFSLHDGSSLPQIVRESRALDAAKRLGLVLDHELTDERFFYIMRYVPGESLSLVTQRLHAVSDHSSGDGLDERNLRIALTYATDLLATLEQYHRGGLWHKDVKPDNIIVDRNSAHLVDFGLLTPLRSAMTLTTHGTEYFRDPELVRMALKGVKVHQVDGAKFDIYAAGAVLFSMIENSFPAHGGLSQITKRCPEALRWIVRRAMTDYDKRYTSAGAMLADLAVVHVAPDPFAVRPADLPSVSGAPQDDVEFELDDQPIRPVANTVSVGDGSDAPHAEAFASAPRGTHVPPRDQHRPRPRIRVRDWWTGGFVVDHEGGDAHRRGTPRPPHPPHTPPTPWMPRNRGASAQEQLRSARARAAEARKRASQRIAQRRGTRKEFSTFNTGVSASLLVFMAVCLLVAAFMVMMGRNKPVTRMVDHAVDASMLYARGQLPDGATPAPQLPAEHVNIRVHNADRPAPRIVVQGAAVQGNADAGLLPAAVGRRILIVSDAQPPTPPINSALERLAASGFMLLGNYPGNTADDAEIEEQLLLEVEARFTRGLGQLDAPDISMSLSEWVGANDDVDLLVWFVHNGDKDGPMKYWVFRAPTEPEDPTDAAHRAAFRAAALILRGIHPASETRNALPTRAPVR